jgi:hypothetical protein
VGDGARCGGEDVREQRVCRVKPFEAVGHVLDTAPVGELARNTSVLRKDLLNTLLLESSGTW